MKALTLYPEHAELFRLGLRTIETRSWSAPASLIGERIAIHAGMRDPDSAAARRSPRSLAALKVIPHGEPLTRGHVVCTVVLADCLPMVDATDTEWFPAIAIDKDEDTVWIDRLYDHIDIPPDEVELGLFEPGRFGWVFTDPEPVDPPVPARGRQRLWRWEP